MDDEGSHERLIRLTMRFFASPAYRRQAQNDTGEAFFCTLLTCPDLLGKGRAMEMPQPVG
jgi:hypothetical protein